jgi:hypothetical protein
MTFTVVARGMRASGSSCAYDTACDLKLKAVVTMRAHLNTNDNLSVATMRVRPTAASDCKFQLLLPTSTSNQTISALPSLSNLPSLVYLHSSPSPSISSEILQLQTPASILAHRPSYKFSITPLPLPHSPSLPISHTLAHSPTLKANPSCPSTPPKMTDIDEIVNMVAAVHLARRGPADPDNELDTEQVSAH